MLLRFLTYVSLLLLGGLPRAMAANLSCDAVFDDNPVLVAMNPVELPAARTQRDKDRLISLIQQRRNDPNFALGYILHDYLRVQRSPHEPNEFGKKLQAYRKSAATRDDVVDAAMQRLKQEGVVFDIGASQMYKGNDQVPPQSYLYSLAIRPSLNPQAHPVNLLAGVLRSTFGISLVFDFSYMQKKNFNGAFSAQFRRVYLSGRFIELLGTDGTLLHEVEHAFLHFLREAGTKDNIFNSVLRSSNENDAGVIGYDSYMNFEELLNHPLSVRISAWELRNAAAAHPEVRLERRKDFDERIRSAQNVVRIVQESLPQSILSLKQGTASARLAENGRSVIVVTSSARSILPVQMTFVDPALIALMKSSPASGRQEALERALVRLEKIQALAREQDQALRELAALMKTDLTPGEVDRLESRAKALLQRALAELKGADAGN